MEVEDAELAKEMIRLLGQELKQLRAQLQEAKERSTQGSERSNSSPNMERVYAVEAENTNLKAQIRTLELEVAQAQLNPAHSSTEKLKLKGQLVDKDRLLKRKDEEIFRLQEAIKLYKENITTERTSKATLQKNFDDTRTLLKEFKHESDKTENRALNTEQEKHHFSYQKFLLSAPRTSRPSEIQASNNELIVQEDTKITLSVSGLETVRFSDREIMWSSDTISRAIAIRPLHYYTHNSERGWRHNFTNKPLTTGQKCVILYGYKGWAYMGSFECLRALPLDPEQFKTLPAHVKKYAASRTIFSRDPIPSLTCDLIEGMYTQGILKAECLVFKFLGFDTTLNKKLLTDNGVLRPTQGTTIPIPGSVHSKRSTDDNSYKKMQSKKPRVQQ